MKNLKQNRIESREHQFNHLVKVYGYTRETYKTLELFTLDQGNKYLLKVYRGTSAKCEAYYSYRTPEQRGEAIQRYKTGLDSREAWKAEQKEKNKGKSSSHAAASAAIKAELTAAFPDIKFSVRSESFSGGNSVHIGWTDGPTTRQVEAISGKYQYGHFNGMEDIYESTNSRDDIPQAKYVSESRSRGEQIQALLPEFQNNFTEEEKQGYRNAPDQILYRVWAQTSFPAEYTEPRIIRDDSDDNRESYKIVFKSDIPEPKAQAEKVSEGIKIIEYGRGIAVIGQTKQFKDILGKNGLGGIFQPRLECGAGWIFKKDRLQEITEALQKAAKKPEPEPEPVEEPTPPPTPEPLPIIPTPKTNPYKLEYLKIIWHEGHQNPGYEGVIFTDWDEVQKAFADLWERNERGQDGGYTKVKVEIKFQDSDDTYIDRIDITSRINNGDFNPSQEHITTHLQSFLKEKEEEPTPPHIQIVKDMNHIMSHFDTRHPVNICDPKSSQYREVIKELSEQPKQYNNLQDIQEAAESGQVISLFNLSQLV